MNRLITEMITPQDVSLLQLVTAARPSREAMDAFLAAWDPVTAEEGRTLLLACFLREHPEAGCPAAVQERTRAEFDRCWLRNMRLMTQFKKISDALGKAGIGVTVFKGGAMKFLRPALPRPMSDIDVIVAEKDWKRAAAVIRGLGYRYDRDRHSFDVHQKESGGGLLDVHRYIPLFSGRERAIMPDLLGRARKVSVFGADASILCAEDLVFTVLVNLTRNLMYKTSSRGILFAFADIRFLLDSKPDFDWDVVKDDAERSGSAPLLLYAIRFMNGVLPGFLPETVTVADREMDDLAVRVDYVRDILCPLQTRSHELGVGKVLKHPRLIPEFLKVRPRYTFLKLFRACPALSRRILSLRRKGS